MLSLADVILDQNIHLLGELLPNRVEEVGQLDIYGFTPLIEAAIVEDISITQLLLAHGADPNQQDVTGGTPLHWAAENNNKALCQLLLQQGANPNAYNFSGQPILMMPILRRQQALKKFLIQSGAVEQFAQDFIYTKLAGHIFELTGIAKIIDPQNHFVDVDFEGFYLEITLGLIADSLIQFVNHFAARKLRNDKKFAYFTVHSLQIAAELIRYQQYRVNQAKHMTHIEGLLKKNPLIIPIGYEGHAITLIRYDNILVKCDRRQSEYSDDKIVFYKMQHLDQYNLKLIKHLLYIPQTSEFINSELPRILGFSPVTTLEINTQISGNCSWANVEAVIPALFFLLRMNAQSNAWKKYSSIMADYKTHAMHFFHHWRIWNQERTLNFIIQRYKTSRQIRQATQAEVLVAILFQQCSLEIPNQKHIDKIIGVLRDSPFQYLLKNYLQVYYYEAPTKEGRLFFELLRDHELI